jgi:serine/threonine protein kinase
LQSEKVDIWALGIIFHQMITGTNPFQHESVWGMSDAIKNEPLKELPSEVSPSIRGIIKRILDKKPENRPSAIDLLKVNVIKA